MIIKIDTIHNKDATHIEGSGMYVSTTSEVIIIKQKIFW